jgi:GntR family transcriptional regulator, transcriptional repressor for pyruvate dehydrogenase complex
MMLGAPAPSPPQFARCVKRRAYEQIVEQVEQAILTRVLKEGDRLPSEREMLGQFGVSRATVREALRVLQSRGLIEVRHGDPGGPVVIADPGAGVTSVLASLARAEQIQLADVVQLRMVIEAAAAGLAAKAPRERIGPVRAVYDEMVACPDRAALRRLDVLFHRRVAEATGNPLMALIAEALHQFGSVALGLSDLPFGEARSQAAKVHGLILTAIEAGDAEAAAGAARHHLHRTYAPKVPPKQRARLAAILAVSP